MEASPLRARRPRRRAAFVFAALAPFAAVQAQVQVPVPPQTSTGRQEPPAGLQAGPVVFTPTLATGYEYDSNVFLRSRDSLLGPIIGDEALTIDPALVMTVPFGNSRFMLADNLHWIDYKTLPQINGRTSNTVTADLDLHFSTFDRLELYALHVAGVAETLEFDPGGEARFAGQSYKLDSEGMILAREILGRRGYRFRVTRNVLKFEPDQPVTFFNFSGYDGEASYLQPLSPSATLSFGYLGTRYDHFDISPGSDPNAVFRTESGDTAFTMIEGSLSPREQYHIKVGWEWLKFTGNDAADFSGVVLDGSITLPVGGGTSVTIAARRQPYRSFFFENNFYVNNAVTVSTQRLFPRGSTVGVNFELSRNTYDEPVPAGSRGAGIVRVDDGAWLEAYANLAIQERVAFRISARGNVKRSNYPTGGFDQVVVFGGLLFGWF